MQEGGSFPNSRASSSADNFSHVREGPWEEGSPENAGLTPPKAPYPSPFMDARSHSAMSFQTARTGLASQATVRTVLSPPDTAWGQPKQGVLPPLPGHYTRPRPYSFPIRGLRRRAGGAGQGAMRHVPGMANSMLSEAEMLRALGAGRGQTPRQAEKPTGTRGSVR